MASSSNTPKQGSGLPEPGLALAMVSKALNKNRKQRIGFGLGAGIIGLSLVFAGWGLDASAENLDGTSGVSSWTLLAAGAAIWGIGFAGLELIRMRSGQERLIQCLLEEGESIVWIYYERIERMPYGIRVGTWTTLHFRLLDREHLSLRCREEECRSIMDALRSWMPHASFGHSLQKEQWYAADPALLRR